MLFGSNLNPYTFSTQSDMSVCVCVCVCACTHTHTHTHTHVLHNKRNKNWDPSSCRVIFWASVPQVCQPWPKSTYVCSIIEEN